MGDDASMTTTALAARPAHGTDVKEAGFSCFMDFAGLSIDTDVREVLVDKQVVELTRLEFDLLTHMAAAPRHTFSRGDLLLDVWHSSPDWQTVKTVTEHVRRIRLKIETDPAQPRWIRTVSGAGYRFEP
jgi:DNA-binding response OmpR family regulator